MSVHGMAVLLASCFNDYSELSSSLEKKSPIVLMYLYTLYFSQLWILYYVGTSFFFFRDISLLTVMSISI